MFESKKKIELWVSCGDDFFYGLEGEKKDLEMAVDFYGKAAKKKHPHAAFMLGLCYELGGKGVKKNIETAEEWYRLAAGYGSDEAQQRLESGNVVIPPPPNDDDEDEMENEDETEDTPETESVEEAAGKEEREEQEAADKLRYTVQLREEGKQKEAAAIMRQIAESRKTSESGMYAAFSLGLYYWGGEGVPLDYEQARRWLTVAKERGHEKADAALESLKNEEPIIKYNQGYLKFCDKDYKAAAILFEEVASQGPPYSYDEMMAKSAYKLFEIAISNVGVSISADKAFHWLKFSARLFEPDAVKALERLTKDAATLKTSVVGVIQEMIDLSKRKK